MTAEVGKAEGDQAEIFLPANEHEHVIILIVVWVFFIGRRHLNYIFLTHFLILFFLSSQLIFLISFL